MGFGLLFGAECAIPMNRPCGAAWDWVGVLEAWTSVPSVRYRGCCRMQFPRSDDVCLKAAIKVIACVALIKRYM